MKPVAMFLRLTHVPRRLALNVFALAALGTGFGGAAEYYVSPEGTGDGSFTNPWSLATALTSKSVQPGDTIQLRGGTYRGTFASTIAGSPLSPVIVRPYRRERAVLDGNRAGQRMKNVTVLRIEGAGFVHFHGLEVMNSDPERRISIPGSNPPERRGSGVDVRAPGIKLINSMIYDTGTALSAYAQARDFEAYGNLIYNNGWHAPDRAHGHGIYTQNDAGTKVYRDNIVLQQFGDAMHFYGSSAAKLRNVQFIGNVLFFGRLLFGGGSPLENVLLEQNMTYNANVEIGYGGAINKSVVIRDNYLAAGILFLRTRSIVMEGNTVFNHQRTNSSRCVGITPPPEFDPSEVRLQRNTYFQCTQNGLDFRFPGKLFTFAQWQEMGFDRESSFSALRGPTALPPGVKAFLRKNLYDPDRATLVIYNWERSPDLPIDVSKFLRPGDEYELRNAQDWFGDVVRGVYDGQPIHVSMTLRPKALPAGEDKPLRSDTLPQAGVFVILRVSSSSPRTPRVGAVLNGASRAAGPVAPGSVAIVAGENLGPDERFDAAAAENVVPGRAAGVRVTFNGAPAPVLYASTAEVAALVPVDAASLAVAEVRVDTADGMTEPFLAEITPVSPALFTADGSGTGQAAALNEDDSVNSAASPAQRGSTIRVAATGLGRLRNFAGDGVITQTPQEPDVPVRVRIGNVEIAPEFTRVPAGVKGATVGAVWMRVLVPQSTQPGDVPLEVIASEQTSPGPVTLSVK